VTFENKHQGLDGSGTVIFETKLLGSGW
jgi:hypothetical protein